MSSIVSLDENDKLERGLHATALRFRLLRQHGFEVSQDVFERSKDKDGELKGDVQGFLGLYEASFLGFEGENLLDEAKWKHDGTLTNMSLPVATRACNVGFQYGAIITPERAAGTVKMGLPSKLEFVRDRLLKVYFWAPDPQFSECRKVVTKMFGLVTIIDDVYDTYGYRWDVNSINTLPDYMKLCFLALNNTTYSILKEKGHNNLS
ncbi:Isoprene synthase, chloroplastic [Glycine soja]